MKTTTIILQIILLFLISVHSQAGPGDAPVTHAPVITACSGQTITVPVTVTQFNNIGSLSLTLQYNPSVLSFVSWTNTSAFPGLAIFPPTTPGTIIAGAFNSIPDGVSFPDSTVLFTVTFVYSGGNSALTWYDDGGSCEYTGPLPFYDVLNDIPFGSYYVNGIVQELLPQDIIPNPSSQAVCIDAGVSATFSGGSGGVSPVDHYESSIDAGATWQPYTPGTTLFASVAGPEQIRIRTWRTSTGTVCTTSGYQTVSWDVASLSVGGAISGGTTVCAGTNSTELNLTGQTGDVINWQSSTDNGASWTAISHTGTSYTANNLTVTTTFRALVQNEGCSPAASESEEIQVNPLLPVSISITADANPVQAGTLVTFTALPVNGGQSPSYQWKVNGMNAGTDHAQLAFVPTDLDQVMCILTSSEVCSSGNPASSNVIIMAVISVPTNLLLQDITLTDTACYNAMDSIIVAGENTFFTIQPGGSATLIAGKSILLLPGATVQEGGYFLGYITPDSTWCDELIPAPIPGNPLAGLAEITHNRSFRVFPNPATSFVYIEVQQASAVIEAIATVYNTKGEQLVIKQLYAKRSTLDLSEFSPGLYMIRVSSGSISEVFKLILQ